jgi:hypothetical protein
VAKTGLITATRTYCSYAFGFLYAGRVPEAGGGHIAFP